MRGALYAAANRAAESARADALYRDPLACDLAGDAGRAVWESMRQTSWPGFLSSAPEPVLSIFTRYFDDALRQAVTGGAIDQVVVLGAALDTRAFRLEWPAGVRLFEVDDADIFEHKEAVLHRLGAEPACRRETIATGVEGAWAGELLRKGFDPARRTAFLVERFIHLPEAIAERTMRQVSELASGGSWIGVALVSRETLRSVFMKIYFDKLESLGFPPWTFGVDDPDVWLDGFGWTTETKVAGDPSVSYGRWPYGYTPRGTPGVPRTFLTQAWKER